MLGVHAEGSQAFPGATQQIGDEPDDDQCETDAQQLQGQVEAGPGGLRGVEGRGLLGERDAAGQVGEQVDDRVDPGAAQGQAEHQQNLSDEVAAGQHWCRAPAFHEVRLSDTATIKGGGPNREGDVVGQSERQLCPTTSPSTSGHDAIDAFVEEFTSMRRGLAFSAKGSVTHKTPSE